ncbi:hypothetical protein AHAS_Ahas10G0030400 [Arachis hypogaea]
MMKWIVKMIVATNIAAGANYQPYGIDLGGPTGRFSNGKTTVDVIRVNYASAAAGGIREETGRQLILYNYGARKMVLFGVGQIGCSPNELAQNNRDACRNRREYVFGDAFHPTDAANTVIGRKAYSAQCSSDAYPIDINRLASL